MGQRHLLCVLLAVDGSATNLPKVFICYRREDAPGYAGRLYDRLQQEFGRDHVFIDVDTLQPGDDFVEAIGERLRGLDVMLAVIGTRWLTVVDRRGKPRLQDEHDYVRVELQTALEGGIRTIPVLVDRATMPRSQDIPAPLRPLARRQAIELSDPRWAHDVALLVEKIRYRASSPAAADQPDAVADRAVQQQRAKKKPQPGVLFGVVLTIAAVVALIVFGPETTPRQPTDIELCDQWDVDACIASCQRGNPPNPRSCWTLGLMYKNGDRGPAQDYRQAADLLGYACDERYANACTQLGWMYEKGLGVPQDPDEAKRLYRRACQDGDDFGCDFLENRSR